MRKTFKRLGIIGGVCALAVGGGIAWAAWTESSTATVTASAGTMHGIQVVQQAAITDLVPGQSAGISVVVTNPNDFPVKVKSVTGPTFSVTGPANTSCVTHGLKWNLGAIDANALAQIPAIPAGAQNVPFSIPNAITMTNASENACKGASFAATFTIVGESDATPAQP